MIGPRRGLVSSSKGVSASSRPKHVAGKREEASRSRSRSRGKASSEAKKDVAEKTKKEKEFAWMDSDSDGGSEEKAAPSPPVERTVPLDQVETLGQMARIAPGLEKRLKDGDVRARELVEIPAALSRSKFFDPSLFSALAKELRRAFQKKRLRDDETLEAICSLAELNAYDADMFEAACELLRPGAATLPEASRQRLEAALKKVNHDPGSGLVDVTKASGPRDKREACAAFWRGQCKWGPKCKLSHDQESFDSTAKEGAWKPPSVSGGKSVGFKQSSDLFKDDRCGALW